MSDVLVKVRRLLTLAADSGASEQEARTAAFQAARLIAAHRIPIGEQQAPVAPRFEAPKRVVIVAKFRGFCCACRSHFNAGDLIAWAKNCSSYHADCARAA